MMPEPELTETQRSLAVDFIKATQATDDALAAVHEAVGNLMDAFKAIAANVAEERDALKAERDELYARLEGWAE